MLIKGSDKSGSMIEPGVYKAQLTKMEDATSEEYGPQIKFTFTVLDADGDPTDQDIFGWASCKVFHPQGKLYKWAKALLRTKCPTPPDDLDTALLLNKRCDVEVVAYKKKDGSDGTKIDSLYPYDTVSKAD